MDTTETNTNTIAAWVVLFEKLERHSVERIYLRQRSFDASKPRVAAAGGGQ